MIKVDPFGAYKLYLALRLHFTTDSYDIVKYRGRVRAKKESFDRKRERFTFAKLSDKYDRDGVINFFVANFISGDKYGGVYEPRLAEERYFKWKSKQESLTYNFFEDIRTISTEVNKIEDSWNCCNGHPVLLRYYLGEKISLEALVILDKLFKFSDEVDRQLKDDPFWLQVSKLIKKYTPFVRLSKDKREIFKTKIQEVFS